MNTRDRILRAAAEVYAELGFRGTTTRRIAEAAGVNEVTLFRLFGSKSALIEAAVRSYRVGSIPRLPEEPGDPLAEVTEWCRLQMVSLNQSRNLLRKFMCDMYMHPEIRDSVRAAPLFAESGLTDYIERLRERGLTAPDLNVPAAAQMLRGAIFGDVMGRDLKPDRLPQPECDAPAVYARLFLRALGVETPERKKGRAGANRLADPQRT